MASGLLRRIGSIARRFQWFLAALVLGLGPNYLSAMGLPDQTLSALTAVPGDVQRGKAAVLDRDKGHCILCHALPEPEVRFSGDIGPPLHGIGGRLSPAQLRFRLIDSSRLNPSTIMPAYYRSEGLNQVAAEVKGRPILSAQEIEDIVAYLAGLK